MLCHSLPKKTGGNGLVPFSRDDFCLFRAKRRHAERGKAVQLREQGRRRLALGVLRARSPAQRDGGAAGGSADSAEAIAMRSSFISKRRRAKKPM